MWWLYLKWASFSNTVPVLGSLAAARLPFPAPRCEFWENDFLKWKQPWENALFWWHENLFIFLQFCLIFHQQFPAINTIVLFWDWFLAVLQFGNNAKMLSLHDWLVMPSEMPQSLRGPFYSVFIEPNLHAPHIITTATVKPLNLFDKCRFQLLQVSYNRFTRAQYASP